jgi:hypothetical protein
MVSVVSVSRKLNASKMTVFWVVAPWSLVEVCQRFRGTSCLHNQDSSPLWWRQQVPLKRKTSTRLHGATTRKTAIFILATVRTSNPTKCFKSAQYELVRRGLWKSGPKLWVIYSYWQSFVDHFNFHISDFLFLCPVLWPIALTYYTNIKAGRIIHRMNGWI